MNKSDIEWLQRLHINYTKNDEKGLTYWLIAAPLGVLFSVLYIAYEGWAISILWKWFVCPLGFKSISVLHAAGLSCTFNLLILPALKQQIYANTWPMALRPILMLGLGYCIKYFM